MDGRVQISERAIHKWFHVYDDDDVGWKSIDRAIGSHREEALSSLCKYRFKAIFVISPKGMINNQPTIIKTHPQRPHEMFNW